MKRNYFILSLLLIFVCGSSLAQQDQLTQLKAFEEGKLFKVYYGVEKTETGYTASALSTKYSIKYEYDIVENLSAFEGLSEESGKSMINACFGWLKPNHYTKPSMFHSDSHNKGYIIYDGLIYFISGVKDPLNITDFEIDNIWVPVKSKEDKNDENAESKKKVSMKEKMAALKAGLTEGAGAPKEIKDKDHYALLKKYIADMKPIQAKATENFTAEEKAAVAAVEKGDADYAAEVKRKNAAYYQSDEYKAVKERNEHFAESNAEDAKSEVTLKNATGELVMFGNSVNSKGGLVNPGSSATCTCKEDVYIYMEVNGVYKRSRLVNSANTNCQAVIEVN